MPRIIFKCRYLKNAASHLSNYVTYVATRDGVEKIPEDKRKLHSTVKQKKMIAEILNQFPDVADLFEYEDYLREPTMENASEFITIAMEQNIDSTAKRENYVDYIATRPRVEKVGSHGLFTDEGVPVVLSNVAEEVSKHTGNVWTPIISLRREDAARLGYDNAKAWMDLARNQRNKIAEQMKIAPENLRWYAAFHNESHHPHIHMIVYSTNPREGYVTKQGINSIRSSLDNEIFRQDLIQIYTEQTSRRKTLAEQSGESLREILRKMNSGTCENKTMEELLSYLAERLKHTTGKKQYGYLKKPLKAVVDQIVDELAKEERVAEAYEKWYELRNEVLQTYKDSLPAPLPLSQQKEFKSLKNMVIAEAMNISGHHFTFEGDEHAEVKNEESELITEETDYELPMGEPLPSENEILEDDRDFLSAYLKHSSYVDSDEENPAVLRLTKAVENGNALAQYKLAKQYQAGEEVEKNIPRAVELFTKSALQNNLYAQYQLGKLYLLGEDVTKDIDTAIRWLTASAKQENQSAQYALGKLYLMGQDVPRDREVAIWWLTLSAEQGNIYARFLLDHLDSFRDPSVFLAATRLMHHISRIFQEEQRKLGGGPGMQVDSKLRRRLRQKKMAQGHTGDEHATQQI